MELNYDNHKTQNFSPFIKNLVLYILMIANTYLNIDESKNK